MISMSFLCCTRFCMNAFGMSTTAAYLCSSASIMHVSSTDYVAMVGDLESYLDIKSLCLFPPSTVIPLMVPYILFLGTGGIPVSAYSAHVTCSSNVEVGRCLSYLPFLPHPLRLALSDSWFMMDPKMAGSCLAIPWLNNMWDYGCNIPMFSICVISYE